MEQIICVCVYIYIYIYYAAPVLSMLLCVVSLLYCVIVCLCVYIYIYIHTHMYRWVDTHTYRICLSLFRSYAAPLGPARPGGPRPRTQIIDGRENTKGLAE